MSERETLVTTRELIGELEARLQEAGVASPRAEAEWFVAEALKLSRTELYLRDEPADADALERVREWVKRRAAGEPLQYILGSAPFCGRHFIVRSGVFIPRPETEALVERAVAWLRSRPGSPYILDVGTGSGAIAVSLAGAVPSCVVTAVELSWMALQVARENAAAHGVADRVRFIHADGTESLRGPFDVIVSNPPYVPTATTIQLLDARLGDPALSLDGGTDGMAVHRRLLADAPRLLAPQAALIMECAEDQAHRLRTLADATPWVARTELYHDLAGRPRGLFIESKDQW